jgi:hypothetical protein
VRSATIASSYINPSRFPKVDSDFRVDATVRPATDNKKTDIAFAKPVTGCKRPFSELFNVAASRPAKSPRDFAFLLGPARLGVNGQSFTCRKQMSCPD